MRSPRIAAVAAFCSFVVLLTHSQTALAQLAPGRPGGGYVGGPAGGRGGAMIPRGGMGGMRRGMPGVSAGPFRPGVAGAGFRTRFGRGFPAGPMLGPIGIGFPRRDGRFFGGPNGFGFFGFPRRQFGFFFDGFPFSRGAFGFDGFPFVAGFPFVDRFRFFSGFPDREFGRFGPHGFPFGRHGFAFGPGGFPFGDAPFGFLPLWFGGWANAPAGYTTDTLGAREARHTPDAWPSLGRQLAVAGIAPEAGDSLVVERVSVMDVVPTTVLRLTWRSSRLEAAQVMLYLADSAQAVLAAQTLRGPPFTALLAPPPGTAYAGMTVMLPDGTTTSRLVPYRVRPR
jgi:hypothetical protein